MQPTNNNGKGFTDEQWDDLLSKTFGPSAPTTSIPEPKPAEPPIETTIPHVETSPLPAPPVTKKRSKLKTKAKLWLAASAVLLIAAVGIFLYYRNASTPEYKQCMEALQQWQSAQCYRLNVSSYSTVESQYPDINLPRSEQTGIIATYFHSEENSLYWSTVPTPNTSFYVGKAKQGDNWYIYSSTKLIVTEWESTSDETPIALPWIMNYSLNDAQIFNQQVIQESEDITVISFTVMDTNEEAEFYGLGVYYMNFYFREGQLYAVARVQPDPVSMNMTGVWFNFSTSTPESIASIVQRQLSSPQSRPGVYFDSFINITIQPRPVE